MINHEHFHLLKFAVNKELNELYISIVLRSLAFSTVLIFIPLYLFKELNFSLNEIIYFYDLYTLITLSVVLGYKQTWITVFISVLQLFFW